SPLSWLSAYLFVKGRSVPLRRATSYCSEVRILRHSSSDFTTLSSIRRPFLSPESANSTIATLATPPEGAPAPLDASEKRPVSASSHAIAIGTAANAASTILRLRSFRRSSGMARFVSSIILDQITRSKGEGFPSQMGTRRAPGVRVLAKQKVVGSKPIARAKGSLASSRLLRKGTRVGRSD